MATKGVGRVRTWACESDTCRDVHSEHQYVARSRQAYRRHLVSKHGCDYVAVRQADGRMVDQVVRLQPTTLADWLMKLRRSQRSRRRRTESPKSER